MLVNRTVLDMTAPRPLDTALRLGMMAGLASLRAGPPMARATGKIPKAIWLAERNDKEDEVLA